MIKNIIFDFGNIIVKFNKYDMVSKFTDKEEIKEFLINEVINSDEWLKKGMIDLGLISLKEMANRINKRTNYKYKNEVYDFSTKFPYELEYNGNVLKLIKKLKDKGYKLYLLSNISEEVYKLFMKDLEPLFDGMVLSYKINMIKPYDGIYQYLINTFKLNSKECLFIDDRQDNIDTANKYGIKGRKINRNDYNDILKVLEEYNIFGGNI